VDKCHRIWFNVSGHCLLFAASYSFSFHMLLDRFTASAARPLFEQAIALLVLIRVGFIVLQLVEGALDLCEPKGCDEDHSSNCISAFIFFVIGVIWGPVRVHQKVVLLDNFLCRFSGRDSYGF